MTSRACAAAVTTAIAPANATDLITLSMLAGPPDSLAGQFESLLIVPLDHRTDPARGGPRVGPPCAGGEDRTGALAAKRAPTGRPEPPDARLRQACAVGRAAERAPAMARAIYPLAQKGAPGRVA